MSAWLPAGNYPARLVQALIIARDSQASDVEGEILDKMKTGAVEVNDYLDVDLMSEVRSWAKEYSKILGHSVL
jgi:hypothetical protein